MIYLGKGVSVDLLEHPYVFGIDGWDPIRIQKGEGRITGVSLAQLEIIIETVKGSRYEQKPDNADVVKATAGKIRTARIGSAKPSKGHGHKS